MKALMARKVLFKNIADRHWVRAQKNDPALRHVRGWMMRPRENRQTLSEYLTGRVSDADRLAYSRRQKNYVMKRNLLYVQTAAPGTQDQILAFVVPANKCQAALDGCHREAGHQGAFSESIFGGPEWQSKLCYVSETVPDAVDSKRGRNYPKWSL